jgi:LPXTG-motif cell wall-anchored protein
MTGSARVFLAMLGGALIVGAAGWFPANERRPS